MLFFADLLFRDLRGDLHGKARDFALQLVHGLAAFEFNFAAGLFAHRVGLRLRGGDDLLAGKVGGRDSAGGDGLGLFRSGLQMGLIRSLGLFGVGLGLSGLIVEPVDLGLTLGDDVLDRLEQEFLEQNDLDQQIADTEAYIKNLEAKISKKKSDLAHEGALLQISLIDWQDQPDSDEYQNLQKLVQLNNYEQQNNEQIKSWQDELEVYNDMLSEYKEYRSEMKSQKSSAEAGKLTGGAKEELEANNKTQTMDVEDSLENLDAAENGIVAEFDGVVTEMNAVEGGATAKGTQLLKLESTEDVVVRITVTKYDLSKIKEGQKAIITIGSREYEGEVLRINRMAEQNNSGAAVVGAEIKILNPDSDVILGVEAKVVINTEKVENAVLVPITAVNVDMDGEFVYVVENNILVKKPVATGISTDTMIQITDGLNADEQIVTSVTADLYEGMTVAAMPQ